MKSPLFGLLLLISDAEAKKFDDLTAPGRFVGLTVTLEYDPSAENVDVVKNFYGEVMRQRPGLDYFR